MGPVELEQYLNAGVEQLVKDILRATLQNPKAGMFFAGYARAATRAEKRRHTLAQAGEHIPSFLIASITEACNLRCAGCYDRANHSCGRDELTRGHWRRIFAEAEEAGVVAVLLAGGEPLMRRDVLEEAAARPAVLFPVFTNGTMLGEDSLALFEAHRNLIPIISIEGGAEETDIRRGGGVHEQAMAAMARLAAGDLLFGASITVTSENLALVTSGDFLSGLRKKGCRAVVFVEYVPVENPQLALDDAARALLDARVSALRAAGDMIVLSFPGDEKEAGGCLAAGRGFFHINASGGAEPCPFSPYADTNLKTTPLREALRSPLFTRLREGGLLEKEHTGGCALFGQADEVHALAAAKA